MVFSRVRPTRPTPRTAISVLSSERTSTGTGVLASSRARFSAWASRARRGLIGASVLTSSSRLRTAAATLSEDRRSGRSRWPATSRLARSIRPASFTPFTAAALAASAAPAFRNEACARAQSSSAANDSASSRCLSRVSSRSRRRTSRSSRPASSRAGNRLRALSRVREAAARSRFSTARKPAATESPNSRSAISPARNRARSPAPVRAGSRRVTAFSAASSARRSFSARARSAASSSGTTSGRASMRACQDRARGSSGLNSRARRMLSSADG